MSQPGSLSQALSGAVALARFDPAGLARFDFSHDGFWRSFSAIAVALPGVVVFALLVPQILARMKEAVPDLPIADGAMPAAGLGFVLFNVAQFVAGWVFFPVAMIWLARRFDLGRYYVPLIVTRNWILAGVALLVRLPLILFGLHLIGPGLMALLLLAIILPFSVAYRWFAIRVSARVSGAAALGLLAVDMLGWHFTQILLAAIVLSFMPAPQAAAG